MDIIKQRNNKMRIYNDEPGICPKCKSQNLKYSHYILDVDSVIYEYECKDCGFKGQEYYDLIFANHRDTKGRGINDPYFDSNDFTDNN